MPGQHASTPREEKRKEERDRGTEGETPNPIPATDALTGDEEQNGKQKKTKRKIQRPRPQPSYPGSSYDTQGSYGEPIFLTSSALMGGGILNYISII